MKNEFHLNNDSQLLKVDRSHICKLWIPNCYSIEEIQPQIIERTIVDSNRSKNKTFLIEDCGQLILRHR